MSRVNGVIVIVCIHVAVFPLPSVAVHVLVSMMSSQSSPVWLSVYVRVTSPHASLAAGAFGAAK